MAVLEDLNRLGELGFSICNDNTERIGEIRAFQHSFNSSRNRTRKEIFISSSENLRDDGILCFNYRINKWNEIIYSVERQIRLKDKEYLELYFQNDNLMIGYTLFSKPSVSDFANRFLSAEIFSCNKKREMYFKK